MPHPRMNRNCENRRRLLRVGVKAIVIAGCCLLIFIFGLRYSAYKSLNSSKQAVPRTESGFVVFGHTFGSAENAIAARQIIPPGLFRVFSSRSFFKTPILPKQEKQDMEQNRKDITDLQDILNEERCKIAFMGDALSQSTDSTFNFSDDGQNGFNFIMRGIENMLEHVVHEMDHLKPKEACHGKA
jgi:hypothetical protein